MADKTDFGDGLNLRHGNLNFGDYSVYATQLYIQLTLGYDHQDPGRNAHTETATPGGRGEISGH
jgi:hypothetical protein